MELNRNGDILDEEDIEKLSREELIERVKQLQRRLQVNSEDTEVSKIGKAKRRKLWKPSRPFEFNKYNKRHIALKFMYLGWDYQGYVVQEYNNVEKTIEDALFHALTTTRLIESRESSNYHRCGRTDIGVSAFSQIISVDVRSKSLKDQPLCDPDQELSYPFLLNRALPPDIQCLSWAPVKDSFSARFDCIRRSYRYFFPRSTLDVESMRVAASYLVGEHDFKNFCKEDTTKNVQKTTTKKVLSTSISPVNEPMNESSMGSSSYDIFIFEIVSHGFLWHQIRCILAVLFLVGQGQEESTVVRDLLDLKKYPKKPQYQLASGLPLVLYQCDFSQDDIGQWIGDEKTLTEVLENLQSHWTCLTVKSAMIQSMIDAIVVEYKGIKLDNINRQHHCLSFEKSKVHKLLSERPTCDKKDK